MLNYKLKGKIISAGHTQNSLAEAIGVSRNTMSSKINGHIPFNTVEVEKICNVLGITDSAEKAEIFLSKPSQ